MKVECTRAQRDNNGYQTQDLICTQGDLPPMWIAITTCSGVVAILAIIVAVVLHMKLRKAREDEDYFRNKMKEAMKERDQMKFKSQSGDGEYDEIEGDGDYVDEQTATRRSVQKNETEDEECDEGDYVDIEGNVVRN